MSNSGTPKLDKLARCLVTYEASLGKPANAKDSAAFRVCEKLRGPLGKLMGVGGFRSLLSRSLALARTGIPSLQALHVRPDGSLEGLDELETKFDSRAVTAGEVALVAQLLGLLVTFIGPALTLRLLHDIWPKMKDLNF
jgi:hypothetical protein